MNKPPRQYQAAMTLVEVLICLLLLSAGIVPILYVFSRGTAGSLLTREEIFAHQYAGELIDYFQARGYKHLGPISPEGAEGTLVPALEFNEQTLTMDSSKFQRRVKITAPKELTEEWPFSYKVIEVEILWQSDGVDHRYTLGSLVFAGAGNTP
jgi:type II secretory pathway pseudopilin PulG